MKVQEELSGAKLRPIPVWEGAHPGLGPLFFFVFVASLPMQQWVEVGDLPNLGPGDEGQIQGCNPWPQGLSGGFCGHLDFSFFSLS